MKHYAAFVACLGAIFSLAPFAIDMYLPALPSMADDLSVSIDEIEASVSLFLLGYACSQLIFGPLSDRFGRMVVLLSGPTMFVIGSVLCALATTVEQLYWFRFIQAIGGGASVVVFALVRDFFDEKGSAKVISYILSVVVIAPLIAPIAGGYVLAWVGWQWIFWLLGVYGLVVVLLTAALVSEPKGNSQSETSGMTQSEVQKVAEVYLKVVRNRAALSHILCGSFAFAGLFAFVAGSPFVYIEYFGVAPVLYGYLVGVNAAVMVVMNLLNARVLARIEPTTKTAVAAMLLGLAGSALFAINTAGLGLVWVVALVMLFVGLLGLISANAVAGALAYFSENESGTASAVYGVCQFGLGSVSSAVVSALPSTDATVMVSVMAASGLCACLTAVPLFSIIRNSTRNLPQTGT